jgi:hypothetical protein
MVSEAQKRARDKFNKKYQAERTKTVNLRFGPPEMDIYDYLSTLENKSGYIKDLIRTDMEKQQQ